MVDIIREMQQLQNKLSQNEKEFKIKKIEKIKLENKLNQLRTRQKELIEDKKEIFREKRQLEEQMAKAKWRLEEIEGMEPRIVPEIDKLGQSIQRLQGSLRFCEQDFFNLQGLKRKLEREYRQLRKARQEMERKSGI